MSAEKALLYTQNFSIYLLTNAENFYIMLHIIYLTMDIVMLGGEKWLNGLPKKNFVSG